MISVIVPIYNVEEYLEECLDSIKNQTYTNIEVILVNDGSTDASKEICKRYCSKDNRFKLINQENHGQSVARNKGVANSTGEFITFVDSDDVVSAKYLENLFAYMTEETDLVQCEYRLTRSDFVKLKELENPQIVFEGNSEEAIIECSNYELSYSSVFKLYRRKLLEDFPFINGIIYEDVYHGIGILKFVRKMAKIDYVGYWYRERPNSTMHKDFNLKNLDVFISSDKLVELFSEDEKLLPYIGKFLVQIVTEHHNYFIKKHNPYQYMYENKLQEYIKIIEKSPKVMRSSKMAMMYKLAPSLYLRYTFPIVNKIWGRVYTSKRIND